MPCPYIEYRPRADRSVPSDTLRPGNMFTIRATPSQRDAIKAEAERRGMTQAALVRQALSAAGVPLWGAAEQR